VKNKNLYDSLEEAYRRLHNTVVTYDGEPCSVIAVTNHKKDQIFRLYLWPVRYPVSSPLFPRALANYIPMAAEMGAYLDKFMEEHKDSPLMRKHANSPAFNLFRPFSLGMLNDGDGNVHYLERSPERRVQQGLIPAMVNYCQLSLDVGNVNLRGRWPGRLSGEPFCDCVQANHPSAEECLENLLDPANTNTAAAFNRYFAFVRGPLDTFFLAHKNEMVGFVPANRRPTVELGKRFRHLKEAVEETNQFAAVSVRG